MTIQPDTVSTLLLVSRDKDGLGWNCGLDSKSGPKRFHHRKHAGQSKKKPLTKLTVALAEREKKLEKMPTSAGAKGMRKKSAAAGKQQEAAEGGEERSSTKPAFEVRQEDLKLALSSFAGLPQSDTVGAARRADQSEPPQN